MAKDSVSFWAQAEFVGNRTCLDASVWNTQVYPHVVSLSSCACLWSYNIFLLSGTTYKRPYAYRFDVSSFTLNPKWCQMPAFKGESLDIMLLLLSLVPAMLQWWKRGLLPYNTKHTEVPLTPSGFSGYWIGKKYIAMRWWINSLPTPTFSWVSLFVMKQTWSEPNSIDTFWFYPLVFLWHLKQLFDFTCDHRW